MSITKMKRQKVLKNANSRRILQSHLANKGDNIIRLMLIVSFQIVLHCTGHTHTSNFLYLPTPPASITRCDEPLVM